MTPVDDDPATEQLARLEAEALRLRRENAELRARVTLDEQLGSDAARYETIVARLAEGVVLQDARGQILTCNRAAERILGLSADQLMGRTSMDPRWRAIHEDGSDFPGETHPAMVSLRTGRAEHGVIMGVHKPDGALTWISINSEPLFESEQQTPHAVVTSFVDITALKESEARARDSEERLRFALRAARMGTWDWDVVTGEVRWSDDVEETFGLAAGTFARTYEAYLDLILPVDRPDVERSIRRSMAGEGSGDYIVEHRVVGADGEIRWVEGFGRVVFDDGGRPVRMAGTVTNITARKALEHQLLHAQRMETVGRLAGGIAHDFNNLLTVILGCVDFAFAHPGLEPKLRDLLETIDEAAQNAARLTKQLLSFARKQVFDLEVFDLCALVRDTERLLRRVIGEDIRVDTVTSDDPVVIRADRAQIEQVLVNLAVNAREAMPGGGTLRIAVSHGEVSPGTNAELKPGEYAKLEVEDVGRGIARSALPHIFDPFFTTKTEGTGLGLSTCYGIVTQLGGSIEVESEAGVGTRFVIHLPLASRVVTDAPPQTPAAEGRGSGRILLVEDDAMVREVTESGLRKAGYHVVVATGGAEALDILEGDSGVFDLLLSDVIMPEMTGYELAVRARQLLPNLPLLFVSGYSPPAVEGPAAAFEREPHLSKPYTTGQLVAAVSDVLERRTV